MKRTMILLALALMLLLALALTGCGEECEHDWKKADCETAKTCTLCGKTKGEPLGHNWKAGTCSSPKTCEICGATQDVALGHSWKAATCQDPKTCTTCGATEGEVGDHTWKDATCMEAKICTTCGVTEGGLGEHEMLEATCEEPITCAHCGLTVGEALGHDWVEGDCETPKTCLTCGMTPDVAPEDPDSWVPVDHVWQAATCLEPKHCENCGKTEGEALGHNWVTGSNDVKTCSVCGATEGNAGDADSRFQTEKCKPLFGTWRGEYSISASDMGMEGMDGGITEVVYFTFNQDGTAEAVVKIEDVDGYVEFMVNYMYCIYEAMDYSKAQADQDFQDSMGMTIREYALKTCEENDNLVTQMVYYVEGDELYMSDSWDGEFAPADIEVKGNKLTMYDRDADETIELVRVSN